MNLRSVQTSLSALLRGRESDTVEQRNARNLILSGAWLGFIDGGIASYLGVWMARLGATPTIMGMLSSGPQLINIISLLPAGAFVERQTDLVRVANRVALIHRSGYVLIALLPFFLGSPQIMFAAIIIWSLITIPGAVHYPALMGVLQNAVPPPRRPRVNANRWAIYSVVGTLCIPLVGAMIDHMTFPVGFQLAFALSFVGSLPNIYFFSKIKIPPFKADRVHGDPALPLLARLRRFASPFIESKPFVRFNLATAAFRLAMSMPAGLFSIFWVDNLHASNTVIGLRGSVGYATLVFGYWFWARVTNRVGHRSLLFMSSLIGLYAITTALSPNAEWLIPSAVIWGFFVAAIDIGFVDMLLLACPSGRQPTFAAVSNLLASVENFIGPLAGAALAQVIGVQMALIVAGVLQVMSGVFFILLPSREQERQAHMAAAASKP